MEQCITLEEFLDSHDFKDFKEQTQNDQILTVKQDICKNTKPKHDILEVIPNPIKVLKPKPVRLKIPKIHYPKVMDNSEMDYIGKRTPLNAEKKAIQNIPRYSHNIQLGQDNNLNYCMDTQPTTILHIPKLKPLLEFHKNSEVSLTTDRHNSIAPTNFSTSKELPELSENMVLNSLYHAPNEVCSSGEETTRHLYSPSEDKTVRYIDPNLQNTYLYDPKPLIRKRRQTQITDEEKDARYWEQRKKNNLAARKSREERRQKELEVFHTTSALQTENNHMRQEIYRVLQNTEQLKFEKEELVKKLNHSKM